MKTHIIQSLMVASLATLMAIKWFLSQYKIIQAAKKQAREKQRIQIPFYAISLTEREKTGSEAYVFQKFLTKYFESSGIGFSNKAGMISFFLKHKEIFFLFYKKAKKERNINVDHIEKNLEITLEKTWFFFRESKPKQADIKNICLN
jgi:hypothetical protein